VVRFFTLARNTARSLSEKRVLETYYATCLRVTNEYYEMESRWKTDSVEMASDATEWLGLKYKNQDQFELRFHDDETCRGMASLVRAFPS
jgi:transcription elongation factor SPT6